MSDWHYTGVPGHGNIVLTSDGKSYRFMWYNHQLQRWFSELGGTIPAPLAWADVPELPKRELKIERYYTIRKGTAVRLDSRQTVMGQVQFVGLGSGGAVLLWDETGKCLNGGSDYDLV